MLSEMTSIIVNVMSQIVYIKLPDRIQYCSKLIEGNNFFMAESKYIYFMCGTVQPVFSDPIWERHEKVTSDRESLNQGCNTLSVAHP